MPGRRLRRRLRTLLLLAFGVAAAFALYQMLTWPEVATLEHRDPESTAFLAAAQARARRAGAPEPQLSWVPYGRISPHLKRAVLVAEDIDFFSHDGFAWSEMKLALHAWREEGKKLRGASTLTQQLAKNLWLSPSRNPWRKLEEAVLTWQLERHLGKRRILELYLNVVELGPGVFGAEPAARRYFGVAAADLDEAQAAALAAALPNPAEWYPGAKSKTAVSRTRMIARRMERAQWLWKVI